MSTPPTSRTPSDPAGWPTLATLLHRILADGTVPDRRRQDLASSLRTIAKALGRSLEELSANPKDLRERLNHFHPAAAGISPRRWRNVVSLLRSALKHVGLTRVPGRSREPLTPAWAKLFRLLSGRRSQSGLSRFARYCSARGIAPEDVDDTIVDIFRR